MVPFIICLIFIVCTFAFVLYALEDAERGHHMSVIQNAMCALVCAIVAIAVYAEVIWLNV